MTTLSDDMKKFNAEMEHRLTSVFVGVVDSVYESIAVGLPTTNAPGQPVRSGRLLKSWKKQIFTEHEAKVSTKMFYARSIEDGVNMSNGTPINLDSPVGGFHSISLTRLGFQRLLDDVTKRVRGAAS
jgi:hypothetical protein